MQQLLASRIDISRHKQQLFHSSKFTLLNSWARAAAQQQPEYSCLKKVLYTFLARQSYGVSSNGVKFQSMKLSVEAAWKQQYCLSALVSPPTILAEWLKRRLFNEFSLTALGLKGPRGSMCPLFFFFFGPSSIDLSSLDLSLFGLSTLDLSSLDLSLLGLVTLDFSWDLNAFRFRGFWPCNGWQSRRRSSSS